MLKLSQIILYNDFEHNTLKDTAQTESQYKHCNAMQWALALVDLRKHTVKVYIKNLASLE